MIGKINASVAQLAHVENLSIADIFALVTLIGLYLSSSPRHENAYRELMQFVDEGHALTHEDVQNIGITHARADRRPDRVFALTRADDDDDDACLRSATIVVLFFVSARTNKRHHHHLCCQMTRLRKRCSALRARLLARLAAAPALAELSA